MSALEKLDLLIVDELGYLSFSRGGAELLFRVFADRYERGGILITRNLPFGEGCQIFQGERMSEYPVSGSSSDIMSGTYLPPPWSIVIRHAPIHD